MEESFEEELVIGYILGFGGANPDKCFVNTQKMDGGRSCFRAFRLPAQLTIVSDSTPISAHEPSTLRGRRIKSEWNGYYDERLL